MLKSGYAASRLLGGTGMAILLASGLALVTGRSNISSPELQVVLLLGSITFILSRGLGNGSSPLSKHYPAEDSNELAKRVRMEVEEIERETSVGNAWAKLEATVLENELKEEE